MSSQRIPSGSVAPEDGGEGERAAAPHSVEPEVEVYVAIGSNVEPMQNIPEALRLLAAQAPITALSCFYQTAPIGAEGQPDFVNAVARVRTTLPPQDFKQDVLRPIEAQLGRTRGEDKYAPRTIDLDILLYGDLVDAALRLPDPEITERAFLARCLLDIYPGLTLAGAPQPLARCAPAFTDGKLLVDLTSEMRRLCSAAGPQVSGTWANEVRARLQADDDGKLQTFSYDEVMSKYDLP